MSTLVPLGIVPRFAAAPVPARADDAIAPSEVVEAVDRYVSDDSSQRLEMGALCGLFQLSVGTGAAVLRMVGGTPGLLLGIALGAAAGYAVGQHCADRYMDGQQKMLSARLFCGLGAFQGLVGGFIGGIGAASPALLCAAGGTALGAVVGAALRSDRSARARAEFNAVNRKLDRTIALEKMALSSNRKPPIAGTEAVKVEDEYVVIGGIRVRRTQPGAAQ